MDRLGKGRKIHRSLFVWYLSIGGGLLLLVYALWRKDPVITLGQLVGVFVYVRNLMLIRRHKAAQAAGNA